MLKKVVTLIPKGIREVFKHIQYVSRAFLNFERKNIFKKGIHDIS